MSAGIVSAAQILADIQRRDQADDHTGPDIEHGTPAAYRLHLRDGQPPCATCRQAETGVPRRQSAIAEALRLRDTVTTFWAADLGARLARGRGNRAACHHLAARDWPAPEIALFLGIDRTTVLHHLRQRRRHTAAAA